MCQSLKHRSITEFAAMPVEESRALLAAACELHGARRAGTASRALQGKYLALMCCPSVGSARSAASFRRAASALGAQVAQVRAGLSELSTPQQVQHTSQMLGRLYDGVECIGMPPELVRRIGVAAGVPVFEAISSPEHPTFQLAGQLADLIEADDCHCTVMQAVLIAALA